MGIEAMPTPMSEGNETTLSVASGGAHADVFGTRPRTGRPHSISLAGTRRGASRNVASRGFDVLLGVGIGAAVTYYLVRRVNR
jgi:hypothetical protein